MAAARPVAPNVTGLPVRPAAVAVSVLTPMVMPSCHEPTVATPLASVVALPPVSEPLPRPIAKVTDVPGTGLPNWSVTITDGAVATFVSTVADCASPSLRAIVAALAGVMSYVELVAPISDPDVAASV